MNIVIVDRGGIIPAPKYGGTERVIWGLGYELHKAGHKVTYIAPKGSSCPFGTIIEYNPLVPLSNLIPKGTDIVHLNFITDTEKISYPNISTIHGNVQKGEVFSINSVFVSKNHANRHNSDVFVHNGLLWKDYPKINLGYERSYYHFLAKASWRIKNLSGAAQIAVKANVKLEVLGGSRWKFYNFKRKPLYSLHPKISYNGSVDNETKTSVMQRSRGLIFPVLWDEPFGLALIESLYAGCPVFGSSRGSLPELIHSDVGFLSNDPAELIQGIKSNNFKPDVCHQYAEDTFSSKKMTDKYLNLYERVLNGESLNTTPPFV